MAKTVTEELRIESSTVSPPLTTLINEKFSSISDLSPSQAETLLPSILAPPYSMAEMPLEEAERDGLVGKIKISDSGKLMLSYLALNGVSGDEIMAFDNLMFTRIGEILRSRTIKFDKDHILVIDDIKLEPPNKSNSEGTFVPLFPIEAKNDNTSYAVKVYITGRKVNIRTGETAIEDNISTMTYKYGNIPVMLGSFLDNLVPKEGSSPTHVIDHGGCLNDHGGYFIVGGTEWLVSKRKNLIYNRSLTMPEGKDGKRKGTPVCRMTCFTIRGTTLVKMIQDDVGSINVHLRFTKNEDANAINILQIFRILTCIRNEYIEDNRGIYPPDSTLNRDYTDANTVFNEIAKFSRKEWENKIKAAFISTIATHIRGDNCAPDVEMIYDIIKNPKKVESFGIKRERESAREGGAAGGAGGAGAAGGAGGREIFQPSYEEKKVVVFENIQNDLFSQIEVDLSNKPEIAIQNKINMLMMMMAKYLETIVGVRPLDDRDNWSNNRLNTAASTMEELLINIWDWQVYNINNAFEAISSGKKPRSPGLSDLKLHLQQTSAHNLMESDIVTASFEKSFRTKRWQVAASASKKFKGAAEQRHLPRAKENISDTIKREGSNVSLMSQMLKVHIAANPQSATVARFMDSSQFGYICPVETPEGKLCGLVISKVPTCWISIVRPDSLYYKYISDRIFYDSSPFVITKFIWNGRFMGWCNGTELYSHLIRQKRLSTIPFDTSIVYIKDDENIFMSSDAGRPVRPLLVANELTGKLLIDGGDESGPYWGRNFNELADKGIIEYVDPWEQSKYLVAQYPSSISDRAKAIVKAKEDFDYYNNLFAEFTSGTKVSKVSILRGDYSEHEQKEEKVKKVKENLAIIDDELSELKIKIVNIKEADQVIAAKLTYDTHTKIAELEEELRIGFVQYKEELENNKHQLSEITSALTKVIDTAERMKLRIRQLDLKVNIDLLSGIIDNWYKRQLILQEQIKNLISDLDTKIKLAEQQLEAEYDNRLDDLEKQKIRTTKKVKDAEEILSQSIEIFRDDLDKLKTEDLIRSQLNDANSIYRRLDKLRKYTHSEMDPTTLLGLAASIIPLPDKNPPARNTYQCGMGKQALSIPFGNYHLAFPSSIKVLSLPSVPIFEPQINETIGLNDMPAGQNLILAFLPYGGWTIEDAIILNKRSVDAGLFQIVIYYSYTVAIKGGSRQHGGENLGIPERKKKQGARNIYHALGTDFIARPGTYLKVGDCVIGKIIHTDEGVKDMSEYVRLGENGIVDEIYKSKNIRGDTIIKVKIRTVKKPEVGDKLASRHAQKVTISRILEAHLMPVTIGGLVPDAIINPHAIPTRMTIGKLVELLTSKVGVLKGERINASAFNNFNIDKIDDFKRVLTEYGFSGGGTEVMINGITGRVMDAEIFIGPMYYQRLRHLVEAKIQARDEGPINALTREPNQGRKQGGAVRMGEMEVGAMASHGAGALIQERLCYSANPYAGIYCLKCSEPAFFQAESKELKCPLCQYGVFGKCTIPYTWKLITGYLAGAGIRIGIKFKRAQEQEAAFEETEDLLSEEEVSGGEEVSEGEEVLSEGEEKEAEEGSAGEVDWSDKYIAEHGDEEEGGDYYGYEGGGEEGGFFE